MSLPPICHSIKLRGCLDDRPFLPEVDDVSWEESDDEIVEGTTTQQTKHSDEWDQEESIKLAADIQTIIRNIKLPTGEEIMNQVRQTTLSPEALKQLIEARRLDTATTVSWEDDSSDEEIVVEPTEEAQSQQTRHMDQVQRTTLSPEALKQHLANKDL